ncbi:MAG: hypothetical protein N2Z20_04430 [Elusimicrobiales bacterium]|nr:hypothetical protein [Elusimicrobiales bacterium]
MRKNAFFLLVLCVLPITLLAGPFDDFKQYFQQNYFKAFVKDVGGVIGANDFNSGRALGFPGFDVGFNMAVQKEPSSDNKILKNADVKSFGIPLIHASIGLPFTGFDIILRGFSYSDLKILGGGIRYNIFKSGMITKFMPDFSAVFYYDTIDFKYFEGKHISLNIVGSWDLPIIKPFAGVGFDRTKLETKNIGVGFNGISETASKPRYTVGIKFCPIPLMYIYGAYSIIHSENAYNFGLGMRF